MDSDTLDRTFAALSDPVRRDIILRLIREPATVSQIAEPFAMTRPAISKHLRVLRTAGVVESRIDGRQSWYSVVDGAFDDAHEWLDEIRDMWSEALVSLKKYVEVPDDGNGD